MTIPIGCLVGGWISGFHLVWMLQNLLPAILLSIVIMISLIKIPQATTKMFIGFSKIIEVVLISGLVIVIFQTLTGVEYVKNLVPIHESFKTIGDITIMLAGAFPLVFFLQHVLKKPFEKAGNKIGLTHQSLVGLLSSLAHHVPMFSKFDLLDAREGHQYSFAVSGSFVLGSHLGFVAAVDKSFIVPMISGKLTAGILAAIIAYFVMND